MVPGDQWWKQQHRIKAILPRGLLPRPWLEEGGWVPSNAQASTLAGPEAAEVQGEGGQRRSHPPLPTVSQRHGGKENLNFE